MLANTSDESLALIATAVTPAVMISATAILIGGISSKHSSLSDRLRSLTSEHRQPQTTPERRANIERQCALFVHRLRLITAAHIGLYVATAFFIAMVLAISIGPVLSAWQRGLISFFLAGITMLLGSVVLEVLELRLAGRTILLEASDALSRPAITTFRKAASSVRPPAL